MQNRNCGANVYALPIGGVVAAGGAIIKRGAASTSITQSTTNAVNSLDINIAL